MIPILRAISTIESGPMSSTSWAKTVLTEFAVALRRVMAPPPPPLTVHGGHPSHGVSVIVSGAA